MSARARAAVAHKGLTRRHRVGHALEGIWWGLALYSHHNASYVTNQSNENKISSVTIVSNESHDKSSNMPSHGQHHYSPPTSLRFSPHSTRTITSPSHNFIAPVMADRSFTSDGGTVLHVRILWEQQRICCLQSPFTAFYATGVNSHRNEVIRAKGLLGLLSLRHHRRRCLRAKR